jgi:hypothetical protein
VTNRRAKEAALPAEAADATEAIVEARFAANIVEAPLGVSVRTYPVVDEDT